MIPSNFNLPDFSKAEILWLSTGLEIISESAFKNFNISLLCKKVGKARTSFYHLFNNMDNFIVLLANYWAFKGTFIYMDTIDLITDPKAKLLKLMEIIHQDKTEGLAWIQLKEYARIHVEIQTILQEVEKMRIAFVASILEELGTSKELSSEKAEMFMYTFFGWLVLHWHDEKPVLSKKVIFKILKNSGIDL